MQTKTLAYGYTLIELLLVITILSTISALTILSYRKNADNNRINKAALEMQHILEAALTYNANKETWPTSNALIPNCTPPNPNDIFIKEYLPNQNTITNFGGHFCWGHTQTSDGSDPLFWVAIAIPLKNSTRIAKQIAARLPNGIALKNPTQATPLTCETTSTHCYVRAEVPKPAASHFALKNQVVGLGYCDPNLVNYQNGSTDAVKCLHQLPADHYAIQFKCPAGETGQVYLFPNFYKSPALLQSDPANIPVLISAKTNVNQPNPYLNSCQPDAFGSPYFTCYVSIAALYQYRKHLYNIVAPAKGIPGTIGATYIAYCIKPMAHRHVEKFY